MGLYLLPLCPYYQLFSKIIIGGGMKMLMLIPGAQTAAFVNAIVSVYLLYLSTIHPSTTNIYGFTYQQWALISLILTF
jgi:hypothetical protein